MAKQIVISEYQWKELWDRFFTELDLDKSECDLDCHAANKPGGRLTRKIRYDICNLRDRLEKSGE